METLMNRNKTLWTTVELYRSYDGQQQDRRDNSHQPVENVSSFILPSTENKPNKYGIVPFRGENHEDWSY